MGSKTITLIDGYREIGEVELICAFEIPSLSGKYIIYLALYLYFVWRHIL